MSDNLPQYVVPTPSPVVNPDLKRQTDTGSLTSFKVGQWLIEGAVIKSGTITLDASNKTISIGSITMDGTSSVIRFGSIVLDGASSTSGLTVGTDGFVNVDGSGHSQINAEIISAVAPISGKGLFFWGNKLESVGIGAASPTIGSQGEDLYLSTVGARTYIESPVIPSTTASSPVAGQTYFNAGTNQLVIYNGTAWKAVLLT